MINLVSDSGPTATPGMLEAASTASSGFMGIGEGPTMADVEARVADLLGKPAGLFVPSGSQANQIAAHVHAAPGNEVLVERASHLLTRERAGLAQLSGLQPRALDASTTGGVPTPEQVHEAYSAGSHLEPATGLLCLENTHNLYGGLPIPPEQLEAAAAAHDLGVPVHLDGARLAQAAIALDESLDALTASVDSAYMDLAKQGAPAGAVLVGEEAFIEAARETRQLFGGHLEGFGMLAAASLWALDHLDRLADDQAHARRLAEGLEDVDDLDVHEPATNLVYVGLEDSRFTPEAFTERCREAGVLIKPFGRGRVRFCTNPDVDADQIDEAVEAVRGIVPS